MTIDMNHPPDDPARTHPTPQSLPPVSPPSPGFIMQLFVIPLIIVMMIVGVWLLIHWAVNRDMQPAQLAKDIERLNHASWQQALTLANQLRDSHDGTLRQDQQLCQSLAEQLRNRLVEGGVSQERVWLRIYLCRALGEFEIADGLPALIQAAQYQQHPADLEVRRAALQAMLLLNERMTGQQILQRPDVFEVAVAATNSFSDGTDGPNSPSDSAANATTATSNDRNLRHARLRSTGALLLGVLGTDRANEQLVKLLDDASRDVRSNATLALARQGDPRCAPMLTEMLSQLDEPQDGWEPTPDTRVFSDEEVATWNEYKRNWVIMEGLRALEDYIVANPEADLESFRQPVAALASHSELPDEVRQQAVSTARRLSAARS